MWAMKNLPPCAGRQQALGSAFTEVGFHEAILKSGAAPFHVVQRNVDAYISEASGALPAAA